MEWKIALIGFGQVGRGLARVLLQKQRELSARHGAAFRVTVICTGRNGNFFAPGGLPLEDLLASERESATWQRFACRDSCEALISAQAARIWCDLGPTNLVHAEPALSQNRLILSQGCHLVAANKGPSVLAGPELIDTARLRNLGFYREATVMSGSPVFSTIDEALGHCGIVSFRGAINGTSNFILSQMEAGQSYESALDAAREQGFAEADPSLDIDGWDSTAKAVILGQHLFGISIPPGDIPRQGIRDFPMDQIQQARKEDRCIRLVSRGIFENDRLHLEVSPLALPLSDPLCMARGTTSALTLGTDLLGEVTITGPGAGSIQTAAGVLSDLLRIHHRYGV